MKKRFLVSVILLCMAAVALSSCGGGGFREYNSALSDLVAAKEKFISDVSASSNAQSLTIAIKAYDASIDKFLVDRVNIYTKNPSLTDRGPYPENITETLERSKKLEEKIDSVLVPVMDKFQADAGAMAAWNTLNEKRGRI